MAKTLPAIPTTLKNTLAVSGAWLVLIDLFYPGSTTPDHRLVNNNEDLTYDGNTYTATPLSVSQVKENIRGELPKTTLTIYDVNQDLRDDLQDNDGFSGGEVQLRAIYFSKTGTAVETNILEYFTILEVIATDESVVFSIGVTAPLSKRFPRDKYVSTICRHRFRDGMCQFTGGVLTGTDIAFVHRAILRDYIYTLDSDDYDYFQANQVIRVTGSTYNNNDFRIISVTRDLTLNQTYINFGTGSEAVELTQEAAGASVTLTVICDKTISACRANNNSTRYGGSPGVAEGIYG